MLSGNIFEIDLTGIKHNVEHIRNTYNNYEYYIGVVKANAYGCGYYKVIETMEKAGINFYAVGNINEALEVRKYSDKGIIILTPVFEEVISTAIENNISVTVDSLEYLKSLDNASGLKIHIKINTGMNRFGTSSKEEIKEIIDYARENNIIVEGIYTHLYYASNNEIVNKQMQIVSEVMEYIDYKSIPMIHIMNSEGLLTYNKFEYTNGIRVGDLLYGLTYDEAFRSVYRLKSKISKIRNVKKGDTVGYDAAYEVEDDQVIAVLPIGYECGIVKANKNRRVYVNDKEYNFVGNICMCNAFVKVDESVKRGDYVDIIRSSVDVMDIAEYLGTAPSEVTCIIDKNIEKSYIE